MENFNMQPSRTSLYMISALTGTLWLAGCGQAEPGASAQAPAPSVGVIELKAQNITLSRELPGRVQAWQQAEIRPQVSGLIQSRLFDEGSQVKAGQALYQIDAAPFEAALASAEAAATKAKASIRSTEAKAKRYRELIKIKAISQQDLDQAEADYLQAKADLQTAQAQIKTARINLNYSTITAPVAGQISKSTVTAGALVSANQSEVLATVTSLDPIYVDITQSSTELLQLKKNLASGQLAAASTEVELLLEDGSKYGQTGLLQFSEVTVDPGTGSVTLRARFPNPDHLLLPGMYVRAVVAEGNQANAILAPQRGIGRNPKGEATALVLNAKGIVEPRIVKAERSIGAEWLITEGLVAGDKLIVEGLQKIRPGAPATAVAAESTPTTNAAAGSR